jgi:hypothetical protein
LVVAGLQNDAPAAMFVIKIPNRRRLKVKGRKAFSLRGKGKNSGQHILFMIAYAEDQSAFKA